MVSRLVYKKLRLPRIKSPLLWRAVLNRVEIAYYKVRRLMMRSQCQIGYHRWLTWEMGWGRYSGVCPVCEAEFHHLQRGDW